MYIVHTYKGINTYIKVRYTEQPISSVGHQGITNTTRFPGNLQSSDITVPIYVIKEHIVGKKRSSKNNITIHIFNSCRSRIRKLVSADESEFKQER